MRRLGRYTLGAELGRGGMSVVHAATAPDGTRVAVKAMPASDAEGLARFEREARLLATLGEAQGFVPLLDHGVEGDRFYVVMPLLEGGTLRARLAKGPLPAAEAVALVARLARALGRAHARGIVHRDVKPENVLFASDGTPLVSDLGLAKHFRRDVLGASQSRTLSATGDMAGTVGFMAPEQLDGAREVGPPADVFALGVILYECLAGRPPFPASGILAYAQALEGGPRPLRAAAPGTPAALAAVVERALARDPARRFAHGAILAAALEATIRPRSKRGLVALLVAFAAVLLPGGFVVLRDLDRRATRRACEEGARLLAARDFRGAVAAYGSAVALAPRLAAARRGRAEARCELGDFDGALADAAAAIDLEPSCATGWWLRSWARVRRNEDPAALADAERAVALDPGDARAWNLLGIARMCRRDLAGATAAFDRCLELDRSFADGWHNRAWVRHRARDFDGAVRDALRCLELRPDHAKAWLLLAVLRRAASDRSAARAAAEKARDLDPKDPEPWTLLAALDLAAGDVEGAFANCNRAIALAPRNANAWSTLGSVLMHRHDAEAALAAHDRAIALDPQCASYWAERGNAHKDGGYAQEAAIADFTRALELDPNEANARFQRGMCRLTVNDVPGAIDDFTKVSALLPRDTSSLVMLGAAHKRNRDNESAIRAYERVIEIAPNGKDADTARSQIQFIRSR